MKLTAAFCKSILDTLPIGYYLGKTVDVKMSLVAPTSMCDMQSEAIIISYPAIAESLSKAPETEDPESQVRAHLYHEISHLILTPQYVMNEASSICKHTTRFACLRNRASSIINIMEDERIETIMAHHFMNVDFKRALELENPPVSQLLNDPDPESQFFAAVRFHACTRPTALRAVERVLEKHLTCRSEHDYAKDTLDVFLKYFYLPSQSNEQGNGQSGEQQESSNGSGLEFRRVLQSGEQQESSNGSSKKGSSSDQSNEEQTEQQEQSTPADPSESGEKTEVTSAQLKPGGNNETMTAADQRKAERAKEVFEAAIEAAIKLLDIKRLVYKMAANRLSNREIGKITTRMKKIIQSAMNRRALQAPSSSAYAGKIDPRLTANKNYRWFIKSNKGSGGNKFSKIKINLFVDCSGSFDSSLPKVNAIIKAFRDVKDQLPEFDYDVVAMEEGNALIPKTTFSLTSGGCNNLNSDIWPIYKKIQDPSARVVNVVVFDGFMWTDVAWSYDDVPKDVRKNAGVFNHPNCIIVTDPSNEAAFTEYAPQAKRIVVRDQYVKWFSDRVFESLERLLA